MSNQLSSEEVWLIIVKGELEEKRQCIQMYKRAESRVKELEERLARQEATSRRAIHNTEVSIDAAMVLLNFISDNAHSWPEDTRLQAFRTAERAQAILMERK